MLFLEQLFAKYRDEMQHNLSSYPMTEAEFCIRVAMEAERYQCICIGDQGILLYSSIEKDGVIYCNTPVFGYYAVNENTLSKLFERLADRMVRDKPVVFTVCLYAHDEASIRLFSMLQFGIVSEKGIRRTEGDIYEDKHIHELSKGEIVCRWKDVWGLTEAIVNHLRQSPVFYPGKEFTEELYREFYMDEKTRVFAAFADGGAMLGMIESNDEPDSFAFSGARSVNIGEIYVLPECRAGGLAKRLLLFAETHSAASCSWLEHGTANPNARGFWGKYYSTYQYTMIREIRSVDIIPE